MLLRSDIVSSQAEARRELMLTLELADPGRFCMVATSDWYRRVLVHFAARTLDSGS
jgi:hypothetical protein